MKKLILISLLLSACGPTLIMLKNPNTKEIVRCAPGSSDTSIIRQANDTEKCAKAYKLNGYQIIE